MLRTSPGFDLKPVALGVVGSSYPRVFSIKYLESRALEFGTTRYKIVLEAILFSALGDACARSTRPGTAKNIHFFGQKFEFSKFFHYMSRIAQNRFQNRFER